jgi:hypothetical protein
MQRGLNSKDASADTVIPLDTVARKARGKVRAAAQIDALRFPFRDFPSGWFAVCLSGELPQGEIKTIRFCAQELVAFRGADNCVSLVEDNRRHAYIRSWPACEVGGLVIAYHAGVGEEHGANAWSSFAAGLRASSRTAALRSRVQRTQQTFTRALLERLDIALEPRDLTLEMDGPGLMLARLHLPWIGLELLTLIALRPVDGEHTEVIASTTIKNWRRATVSGAVRDLITHEVAADFAEDVMVLESKCYRETGPGRSDGAMTRLRRCAEQFYGARVAADLAGQGSLCEVVASHCEAQGSRPRIYRGGWLPASPHSSGG